MLADLHSDIRGAPGDIERAGWLRDRGHEGSKYAIEEWLEIKYVCLGGIDA